MKQKASLSFITFFFLNLVVFTASHTKASLLQPLFTDTTPEALLSEILSDRQTDPFRVLEQLPFVLEKAEHVALWPVKLDWKETETGHVIVLDVSGLNKDECRGGVVSDEMKLQV
ncbi:unnamed protein product [Rhodiola kirilowii]